MFPLLLLGLVSHRGEEQKSVRPQMFDESHCLKPDGEHLNTNALRVIKPLTARILSFAAD